MAPQTIEIILILLVSIDIMHLRLQCIITFLHSSKSESLWQKCTHLTALNFEFSGYSFT